MATTTTTTTMCIGDCVELGPPPNSILSMPPPPFPAFLVPRSAIVAVSGNNTQPCFAAYVCEPSLSSSGSFREQTGIEFIEFGQKGASAAAIIEDTWIYVLISSCVGVLLLGALFAFILMRCREMSSSFGTPFHGTSHHHQDTLKQPPMHPIIGANLLYPNCSSTMMHNSNGGAGGAGGGMPAAAAAAMDNNRMLWATLTPHGTTRHIMAGGGGGGAGVGSDGSYFANNEDHYEVVDYYLQEHKMNAQNNTMNMARTSTNHHNGTPIKVKSFDNSGFVDFDYADPTPLMMHHNDDKEDDLDDNVDLDSGYQEPQEVLSSARVSANNSPSQHQSTVNHYNYQHHQQQQHQAQHPHQQESSPGSGTRRKNHRYTRPIVSSPIGIENPNLLPPLNLYPQQQAMMVATAAAATMGRHNGNSGTSNRTLNKSKYITIGNNNSHHQSLTSSLNRRISDLSNSSRNCANI